MYVSAENVFDKILKQKQKQKQKTLEIAFFLHKILKLLLHCRTSTD